MKKRFTYLIGIVLSVSLVSCVAPASLTSSGPRTLVVRELQISEEEVGGFVSWTCQDFVNRGDIVVEVGYFVDQSLEEGGFILFDGGHSGEFAVHERTGLEHRWDWVDDEAVYAFVINTDGSGLYYDFSNVPDGEETKPKAVYICKKR